METDRRLHRRAMADPPLPHACVGKERSHERIIAVGTDECSSASLRPCHALRLSDLYYDGSGFFNFGYWTLETKSQREASENLVNLLLALIPEKRGTILDVACGLGATTRMLLDLKSPEMPVSFVRCSSAS